jgi:hypothetical protein
MNARVISLNVKTVKGNCVGMECIQFFGPLYVQFRSFNESNMLVGQGKGLEGKREMFGSPSCKREKMKLKQLK